MENKYYLTSDGELRHYGVPGMKWGVRKKQVDYREYKADRKRARNLIDDAKISSDWSQVYGAAAKYHDKKLAKRIKKDNKKYGSLSEKTLQLQRQNDQLHRDKTIADNITSYKIENVKKFVNDMKNKYPDMKIKDVKTKIKHGQEIVDKLFSSDPAAYSIQQRSYIDENGDKQYRFERVRTTYHYY